MGSFTRTWNSAYEASPAGTDDRSTADDRMREIKTDVRERMQAEHNFSEVGGGTDDGSHKAGECGVAYSGTTAQIAALSDVANAIAWDTALGQWKRNSGSAWAVASPVPQNAKTVWYSDTALAGWTLDDTMDDKVLFVTKGSVAGGETGGAAHSAGTWTQPDHTHTGPSHTHGPGNLGGTTGSYSSAERAKVEPYDYIGSYSHSHAFTVTTGATAAGGTGSTGGGATANTWRPAAYCCTMQTKN